VHLSQERSNLTHVPRLTVLPERTLSARELVRRLIGPGPVAGWAIRDIRAASGLRVTFTRQVQTATREVILILRPPGQPGFFVHPRLSMMQLGSSITDDRSLLDGISRLLKLNAPSFAPGELENGLEAAARSVAPVAARQVDERSLRPGNVELRLNLACNEACFFCNCDGFAPNVIPDAQAAIETARQLGLQKIQTLTITGGEPTLHHALVDVARAAHEAGARHVAVQTNAVLLAEGDLAARLRAAGVDDLLVSLHSSRPEISDRITGTAGAHALTVRGIDAALDAGLNVTCNFVTTKLNEEEPLIYVRWLRERFEGRIFGRLFSFMAPVAAALRNLSLIPQISVISPRLLEAMEDCFRAGEWARIAGMCGVPLCVIHGYERLSDEWDNPPGVALSDDRTKLPACTSCQYESKCSGVWKEYVHLRGGAEFVPVAADSVPGPSAEALSGYKKILAARWDPTGVRLREGVDGELSEIRL
jgi:hypothetical protein